MFGKRLAGMRKEKNLSQADVVSLIGIRSYQRYEHGYPPNKNNFNKLVDFYQCSGYWLFSGDGEQYPSKEHQDPVIILKEEPVDYKMSGKKADFDTVDAMRMVTNILLSGTSYANALFLKIQHFDRAITAESRISNLENKNNDLNNKISKMEHLLALLEEKLLRDDHGREGIGGYPGDRGGKNSTS